MPFAKMSKTNRRTDILPNLVAVKKKMGRLMEEVLKIAIRQKY